MTPILYLSGAPNGASISRRLGAPWRAVALPGAYLPSLSAMSYARSSSSLRAFQFSRLLAP
jgi:hypothetical protein